MLFNIKRTIWIFLTVAALVAPVLSFAYEGEEHAAEETPIESISPDVNIPEKFYRARVLEVNDQADLRITKVKILSGDKKGQELVINEQSGVQSPGALVFKPGDKVVVSQFQSLDETIYYIADYYRIRPLVMVIALFFGVAIFFGRLKGLTSVLGLAFTVLVLGWFIVPQILEGRNPIIITLLGAFVIALISIYLAHGFNRRTSLALLSTIITLVIASALAFIFVSVARLLGLGSEEAMLLQVGLAENVNLKGLLLGGIIIGTLGILDDITTSQTAAVDEISKANASLEFGDLYKRGLSVGHEHIAALINTLVLAYAGAALPLFLLFSLNDTQPWWVVLNGELIAEEIVRTVVGSIALVLAVPITTLLAAYYLPKYRK